MPGIKKGQQSYPIVVDGRVYVTSGDDQVFAVNGDERATCSGATRPTTSPTFRNYGIVANRGVAVLRRPLFLLTLDMTIVALDPETGKQLARVPIGAGGPGCVRELRLLGDERPDLREPHRRAGRGRLRLRRPRLRHGVRTPISRRPGRTRSGRSRRPAPAGASAARLVGGATVWTPTTVDPTTNTLYFGTAAASPAYYPSLRPGSNPRADSLIAVDLATGKLKWWQQQLASNEWAYDASQPPLVYTAKIGGKDRRIVSIATMEGVWFAFDAATGAPIYQRVKVIDNVEHPTLKPGKPVAVYPASIGGLNYSPASYSPQTHYVYNAAAETAAVVVQQQTPAQQKHKRCSLGNTFLGLANGDFGPYLQSGWRDYGSVSAIDVATGKRVWKFNTPEPERGGVTTTASGLGFVGGGDGNLRAFDAKSGKVLWKFQTGRQIAAAPTIYAVNGKEYVAITVGGTATSSERRHRRRRSFRSSRSAAAARSRRRPRIARPRHPASQRPRARGRGRLDAPRRRARRGGAAGRRPRIVTRRASRSRPGTRTRRTPRTSRATCCSAGKPGAGRAGERRRLARPERPTSRGRSPTRPTSRCRRGTSSSVVGGAGARRSTGQPLTAAQQQAVLRGERRHQRRLRARRR